MGKNTILGFDWEKDIARYSTKENTGYVLELIKQEELKLGYPQTKSVPLVHKVPSDSLVLKGSEKKYQLDIQTLEETIDKYMDYCGVMSMKRDSTTENDKLEISIPEPLAKCYYNYKKRTTEVERQSELVVILEFFEYINRAANTEQPCEMFQLPRIIAPIYLHSLYREVTIPKNASSQRSSLEYDGLKFLLDGYDDFIPSFSLANYIQHELITKISLSIEIASILLEMDDFCKKLGFPVKLREKAYDAFKDNALPSIAKSDCIFARITAARRFFQHIMLEVSTYFYQGAQENKEFWKFQESWDEIINHASIYSNALYSNVIGDSDSNVECASNVVFAEPKDKTNAIKEVETLLYDIEEPIDLHAIVLNHCKRLAIFCNPKHKYVSRYIDILNKRSKKGFVLGNAKKRSSEDQFGKHRGKLDKLFQNVHKDVKKAAAQLNNQIEAAAQPENQIEAAAQPKNQIIIEDVP